MSRKPKRVRPERWLLVRRKVAWADMWLGMTEDELDKLVDEQIRALWGATLSVHRSIQAIERHAEDPAKVKKFAESASKSLSKAHSCVGTLAHVPTSKRFARKIAKKGAPPHVNRGFGRQTDRSRSVDVAAKELGVSRETVVEFLRKGQLKGSKVNHRWSVEEGAVEEMQETLTQRAIDRGYVCPRCKAYFYKRRS